ncbi:hypothetical protein M0R45_002005 [Rubus argutus]|uniref:Uncharacterized protein n=1 Tax=Rubus argutus TaxID=59490 RepID=A0AAW1VKN1_RUBAR
MAGEGIDGSCDGGRARGTARALGGRGEGTILLTTAGLGTERSWRRFAGWQNSSEDGLILQFWYLIVGGGGTAKMNFAAVIVMDWPN